MINVIELGPFGCTLDHGNIQSLDEIPEGYTVKNIITSQGSKTAFIEPDTRVGEANQPTTSIKKRTDLHK